VRLHPMRRLRAGRYALVVRAGSAAGPCERRMSLVVR
jgi:membrane associated rhomboid family serine protease